MKRTSVRFYQSPSYSPNAASQQASRKVRIISLVTITVGLILVCLVIAFILKHAPGAAVLSVGLIPGNPFGEGQQDDDGKNLFLGILGVIDLVIGLPLAFIL